MSDPVTREAFLQLADLLPEPTLLLTGTGTVLAANGACDARLGLAPAAVEGRPLAHLVSDPPEAVGRYLRACSRSRTPVLGALTLSGPGSACRAEGAVLRPAAGGADALVLLRLVPKQSAAGQFVALNRRIDELGREVHRRKRAEEETRRQEERYRVTLSSIGDAVIATDGEGRVTFLNPIAEALTGWTAADGVGTPLPEVFRIVNEHTRAPAENPALRALREGTVVGLANHTVLIARDGTERPIDDSAAPIRDAGGAVGGAVLVFRDVTGRKQAEEALRESEGRHRVLADLAAATQPLTDPAAIMAAAARLLAEHLGVDRCAYAEVEDEAVYVITGDFARGVPSIVGRWPVAAFGAEHHRMMRANEPYVVEDADADPRVGPADLPAYRATAIRAVVCVPLHKGGRFTAAMAVQQAVPRRWTAAEVGLVTTVVGRCWEALERARVDRALRASEAQLRLVTDTVPALIASVGADHRYRFVNRQYEAWFGRPREEVEGRHLREVVGPEAYEVLRPHVERALAGERFEVEAFAPYPTGDRYVHAAFVPQLDGDRVAGYFSLITDVTARRQAEDRLRQAEERFRAAVAATSEIMWTNDAEGRMTADQPGWAAFTGQTPEEYQGYGWAAAVHPDDARPTVDEWNRAVADRRTFVFEHRVRRRDGEYREFSVRAVPLLDPDGTVREWVGTHTDVTDRKRAARALQASEERFRAFMDHSPAAAWVTDADGRVRYVSAAYARLFRVPDRDLIGAAPADLYPEGFAREYVRNIRAVAESGRPLETTERAPRPDGSVGEFLVYKFPLPGSPAVGGVAVDITDRRRAEEALRDADRRKDEFLALLAHELRNPLAPLRNGLQVMRLAAGDAAAVAKAREMMDRQLAHMVRLIDDLLDVSRISRNKMELRRTRLLLADVVASAVETVRPGIDAAGHDLAVSLPGEPIHLDADLTRLAQVFGNLLANSAKYTPPGGRIWLAAEARDGQAVVTVRDTGIGIPAGSLPNIFDMFSQVDRSIERSTGGLGIGLALVKGLVEMHGGTVTAESGGPGQGSTFTVRLPVLRPAEEPAPVAAGGPAPVARPARRVLVVDDNRDGAESMADMLGMLGNEVRTAGDGLEAVAAAEAFRPEVILMDVGMPRMNGYDATRQIRGRPWGKGIVILALTGWGQDGDREQSREAGCDGHLVKPVSLPDLERRLGELSGPGAG